MTLYIWTNLAKCVYYINLHMAILCLFLHTPSPIGNLILKLLFNQTDGVCALLRLSPNTYTSNTTPTAGQRIRVEPSVSTAYYNIQYYPQYA